jgi:hypothetical protein
MRLWTVHPKYLDARGLVARGAARQDGVGPIILCDVPAMMAEHDAAHRVEIRAWQASRDAGRAGPG